MMVRVFRTTILCGLAAAMAGRDRVVSAATTFENLSSLIASLDTQTPPSADLIAQLGAETTGLMGQFNECGCTYPPTPSPTTPPPAPSPATPPPSPTGAAEGWIPKIGDSWNYNLQTPVKTSIDVDVFFIDMDYAQDTIDYLHDPREKVVVCYISIGTWEEWRADAAEFVAEAPEAIGNALENWDGEKYLDGNNAVVRAKMTARVQKAKTMNCDAIEPDNMMVYTEQNTGVTMTMDDQIDYNTWFAQLVHDNGMKVGLKNAVDLVPLLEPLFDFALNEECNQYNECGVYTTTFLAHQKPVFNVEYVNNKDMCTYTNGLGLDTIVKNYNLKAHFCSCVDSSRDWKCNKVI